MLFLILVQRYNEKGTLAKTFSERPDCHYESADPRALVLYPGGEVGLLDVA